MKSSHEIVLNFTSVSENGGGKKTHKKNRYLTHNEADKLELNKQLHRPVLVLLK